MTSKRIEFFDGFTSETIPNTVIATGPAGDMVWQGVWVSGAYTVNQIVHYTPNGNAYVCHAPTTADQVPTDVAFWDILVENLNLTSSNDNRLVKSDGVSGNAVYDDSLRVQSLFYKNMLEQGKDWKITACGGINSLERLKERLLIGAQGIQIYTPLIFSGPKILREFRNFKYLKKL